MTDQMDNRLKELVTKVAASAPDAPPFPRTVDAFRSPIRRMPAWALSMAGAAAVLLVIGVPFLLFSGGRSGDVATTIPTTDTTVALTPPSTAQPEVVPGLTPTCVPDGLQAGLDPGDGAAGHVVTLIEIVNVSGSPCLLDLVSVTGIGSGGEEVPAALATYVPNAEDAGSLINAGESRTMLVETGTGCQGGRVVGPAAAELAITIDGGELRVPFVGDLGCTFGYSDFAQWSDIDQPNDAEVGLAEALAAWATEPTGSPFPALADTVILTLGPEIARSQTATALADPATWEFNDADGFRGYAQPFSALDLLAAGRPIEVTAGPHDHCAGPPITINEAFVGLRHLSIQPTDATSCLEWWTVDLFLNDDLEIAGVTLDLWEP